MKQILSNRRMWGGLILGVLIVSMAMPVLAAGVTPPNVGITKADDLISKGLCNIVYWMWRVLLVVSILMILYGAWEYVLSQNEQEKITGARRTITYAAIGLLVSFLAWSLPAVIASVFDATSGNADAAGVCASSADGAKANGK